MVQVDSLCEKIIPRDCYISISQLIPMSSWLRDPCHEELFLTIYSMIASHSFVHLNQESPQPPLLKGKQIQFIQSLLAPSKKKIKQSTPVQAFAYPLVTGLTCPPQSQETRPREGSRRAWPLLIPEDRRGGWRE